MSRVDWQNKIFKLFNMSEAPIVQINNNTDSDIYIEGIYINSNTPQIYTIPNKGRSLRRDLISLEENTKAIDGIKAGEDFLVNKLKALNNVVKKTNLQPIIRQRVLFSGFSTIREASDSDDMSVLELDEKRILVDLAQYGCEFRLILNLDILKAVACGYGKEEIARRIGDLCQTCDDLSDKQNFDIVVDTTSVSYEPIWTIDDILMHRRMGFAEKSNYQVSFWDSNINDISIFNAKFDVDFYRLNAQKYNDFRNLKCDSIASLIYKYTTLWIDQHPTVFGGI